MSKDTKLELQCFYPLELEIKNIVQKDTEVSIKLKSCSTSCVCPKCGVISEHKHGTYERKSQDLPILMKATWLYINAYEYECKNEDCEVSTFAETINGFPNFHSRITERCADFVCTLALETSCEGCARICKSMNLKTSGDSVIRLLTKRFK